MKEQEFIWNIDKERGEYWNEYNQNWEPLDFSDKENQKWIIEKLNEARK